MGQRERYYVILAHFHVTVQGFNKKGDIIVDHGLGYPL